LIKLILVVAIVCVLVGSGISFDAFADHVTNYDINKKAVLLQYAGNGGSPSFIGEGGENRE